MLGGEGTLSSLAYGIEAAMLVARGYSTTFGPGRGDRQINAGVLLACSHAGGQG